VSSADIARALTDVISKSAALLLSSTSAYIYQSLFNMMTVVPGNTSKPSWIVSLPRIFESDYTSLRLEINSTLLSGSISRVDMSTISRGAPSRISGYFNLTLSTSVTAFTIQFAADSSSIAFEKSIESMLATRYANVSDVLVSRSTIDALSGSYSWRVTFHPLFDQNISLQLSSSSLFLNTNVRANVSVTRLQEALSFRTIDYSKITLSFMNYSTRPITLLPFHKASFMNVSSVLNASISNSLSDAVDRELEILPSIGRVRVFESGCPDLSKIHFRASQDCIAMTIRFGAENDLNVNTLSPRHLGSVPLLQIHVLSGFVEHATVKVDRKGRGYLNYTVSVTNNGVDFSSPALSGNKLSFFELENVKITQLYPPLGPEFGGTLVILSLYYDALDRSSTRSPYALHLPGFNRESNSAFCRFGNTVVPAVFVDSTDRIAPQWLQELGVDVINGASSIAKLISTTATPPMPFSIFSLLCVTPPILLDLCRSRFRSLVLQVRTKVTFQIHLNLHTFSTLPNRLLCALHLFLVQLKEVRLLRSLGSIWPQKLHPTEA
jgi:hypothetical protein